MAYVHIKGAGGERHIQEPGVKNNYQYVFDPCGRLDKMIKLIGDALETTQGRYKHYYSN